MPANIGLKDDLVDRSAEGNGSNMVEDHPHWLKQHNTS